MLSSDRKAGERGLFAEPSAQPISEAQRSNKEAACAAILVTSKTFNSAL
jgi:hypothetical protein